MHQKADETKLERINFQHGPVGPNRQGWFFPMMEKSNHLEETSSYNSCFLNCKTSCITKKFPCEGDIILSQLLIHGHATQRLTFGLWNTTFMTGGDFFSVDVLSFFVSNFARYLWYFLTGNHLTESVHMSSSSRNCLCEFSSRFWSN